MHEYYFKIKKGDLEFEFSTSDKFTFEEKLSDWINGVVKGSYVAPPKQENTEENPVAQDEEEQQKPERSGFIDVKNISSINQIQMPTVAFSQSFENNQQNEAFEMPQADFEQALEESMQNPKTEVVEKQEISDSFSSYVSTYTPQSQTDFLIVTASYIMNVEHAERFSIKQLNSKLIPYIGLEGKPIDHADIQEAINQGLIRIVPDLTGTSEVTEYTLTQQGEGYFIE